MRLRVLPFPFALALLAGCASHPLPPAEPVPVVLVSVDGLRPRDITPERMPRLAALGAEGAWAREGMRPSFPSLTFPNHYTIVTGLRPDHHGIVQNSMRDAALGEFRLSKREAVGDRRWWGGEPVWVSAERAGKRTATLFWPGSEADVQGVRPTRWQLFDAKVPPAERADKVAGWINEPAATRPTFATLYFDAVDHAQHDHSPDSPEALAALKDTDAAIGRFVDDLRASGQLDRVNIIVVSDHGFAPVPATQFVAVDDVVAVKEATAVSLGQVPTFQPNPGFEQVAERKLLGRHPHFECWRKGELPARWHYGTHPRVPPIVCQMDEGWDMISRDAVAKRMQRGAGGSHGFDPALPSMRAAFIAHGPSFRAGSTLPVFDNVDVYPLLMRLLRLKPAPNDGDPRTFDAVLEPAR